MLWTVILENILECPLDCKEIKPVHPKENQSWVFIGRTDAEAETLILWPPDAKNWLIWKDPDAGMDWRREEKGATEDEIVGWHHWLYGHEFEQVLGVCDGQGGLACCSPWGHKELDMTEWLNCVPNWLKRWCCENDVLNMPANLENSSVAIGLEKISFHSNPKEGQCQRMFKLLYNCTNFTCY